MKLSKWAKQEGITYRTSWVWFHKKQIPFETYRLPSGMIMVDTDKPIINKKEILS
jgi:putative resolvase